MNIFGITDPGSLADWTTAVIAFLAFVAAGIATVATIKTNNAQRQTLELQQKQYEDARQQLRRSQAQKIVVWQNVMRPVYPHGKQRVGSGKEPNPSTPGVFVLNASEAPIHFVTVVTIDSAGKRTVNAVQTVIPPKAEPVFLEFSVDPRDFKDFNVYFHDADDVHWVRRGFGWLDRLTAEEDDRYQSDQARFFLDEMEAYGLIKRSASDGDGARGDKGSEGSGG